MTPRATVRLQLTREFGFDAARDRIDYYAALGISHYYLSPIFQARAGSAHGYDIVDFNRISDELGGSVAFLRMVDALRARGMGVILDIVPNHMGVAGNDNAWWNDVLALGRSSRYARHFDIDWTPEDRALHGKVLLPFLERSYAEALADAQLALARDADRYCVAYQALRWPLSAESHGDVRDPRDFDARDPRGRERLHALLERQHWRLDSWRAASGRINWRRFFEISELAALRIEDDRVFDDVHKLIFTLFADGAIDGVRVDHVDGLAEPLRYCQRLRDEFAARQQRRPPPLRDAPAYIVVEKIFAAREPQRDWGVAGTTGYDFMDQVGALLHNPGGLGALDVLWRRASGQPWQWRAAVLDARRQVLDENFGADLDRVMRAFHALAVAHAAHLTQAALRRALIELAVAFPVYRSYGEPGALPPQDAAVLAEAVERANRHINPGDYDALDFIARCLRDPLGGDAATQRAAALRFQQLTVPIAAKAIEDTAFYREARMLSRNEVGSDPDVFALGYDEFHAACIARAQRFPHSLLTTATHDNKRGEDARMRLAVLSDIAERWTEAVAQWNALNATLRGNAGGAPAPDAVDELMLYQTLVGAWPLDPAQHARFRERIARWWIKALREAKRHSSWIAPNAAYEEACLAFLAAILEAKNPFVEKCAAFVDGIAAAAALNGLVQTFLRLTTPGVPDLYQGRELWDFSLVDPDNRSPVDYAPRRAALAVQADLPALLARWRDGAVKQALIARLLAHRAEHPTFYASADYVPLPPAGMHAAHVIAFERRSGESRMLAVAMRWALEPGTLERPCPDAQLWHDTRIETADADFHDVLGTGAASPANGRLRIAEALRRFPVALYFAPSLAR